MEKDLARKLPSLNFTASSSTAESKVKPPNELRRMDYSMFSGEYDLNYSLNLSDDQEVLDAPPGTAKLSPAGFVVLSVVLGFIMTFGFLNNFVVLLLFCKFKKLRTPVNMLLLNISVSDMLVCLFGTTLSFASSIRGKWLLGRSGCSWYGFINSCFGR